MRKRILYIILGLLVALIIIAETLSKGFSKEAIRTNIYEPVMLTEITQNK